MTNLIADIGWGVFWQTFFSGLVEGGRETFMGPIARSAQSSLFNVKNELRTNQMLDQNQHVMVEQDLQQQEVSYASQFATTSLILFGTLLVSGFLGTLIGPSIAAGLTATVVMFQGDGDGDEDNKNELARARLAQLAEMIRVERTHEILLGNIYGGYDFDPLWDRISNDQWNIFIEGQEIIKEEQTKISPLLRIKDWLKEHKKGLIGMVAAYIGIGILNNFIPGLAFGLSPFAGVFTYGIVEKFFGKDSGTMFAFNPLDSFILSKRRKDGSINLEYYARKVIEDYVSLVLGRLTELGYQEDQRLYDFSLTLKNNIDLMKLVSAEGKLNYLWNGFTYLFIDKDTGFYQVGYSTQPYPRRFNWYMHDIIEKSSRRRFKSTGEKQIYGWVYDYLDKTFGIDSFKSVDGRYDYSAIKKAIKHRFSYEVVGVYWGESKMKEAESELISIGKAGEDLGGGQVLEVGNIRPEIQRLLDKYGLDPRLVGKALNDPTASGRGSKSPNPYLLLTIYYIAQGYSHRQIYSILVARHKYTSSFSKFFKDFKVNLGSIYSLRELFAVPLVRMLRQEGLNQIQIDNLLPLLKSTFDEEKFIDLVKKGYELKDMAKIFGYSIINMKIKIDEMIEEKYPDLPIYVKRENVRGSIEKLGASWEDLRYYLLAQEIHSLAADGKTIKDAASSFYSPSKPNGFETHFITTVCKAVLKMNYRELKNAYIQKVFKDIVIHTNDPKYQDFINDARLKLHFKDSRGRSIARNLAMKYIYETGKYSYLIHKIQVNKELSVSEMDIVLKCAIYGIIAPLLKECYKSKLTPEMIQEKYGFFASEKEVVDWTIEIFGMESDDLIRILYSNDLNVDLTARFGVK